MESKPIAYRAAECPGVDVIERLGVEPVVFGIVDFEDEVRGHPVRIILINVCSYHTEVMLNNLWFGWPYHTGCIALKSVPMTLAEGYFLPLLKSDKVNDPSIVDLIQSNDFSPEEGK